MKTFEEKFYALLVEKLNVDEENLSSELKFTDLGADSLDVVEIIVELETVFGVVIPDEDTEAIVTIGNAKEYLKNKLNIP